MRKQNKFFKRELFSIDLRALAVFRIVLGFNIIYNLLFYRIPFINPFYGENEFLDKGFVLENYGELFSILNYCTSYSSVLFFFILVLVLAVLFTIGLRSKIISVLLFITFSSIVSKNPFTVHGVEFLIEVSLFWSIFLPINQRYSINWPKSKTKKLPVKNLASFGFLFQIALIYFTSFFSKTSEFWQQGFIVEALTDDRMHAVLLSDWIKSMPTLAMVLTYATLLFELLIPLLIFSPWRKSICRFIAAILIVIVHFGLASMLNVGPFHWITLCFALVLLPTSFWDKIQRKTVESKVKKSKKRKEKPTANLLQRIGGIARSGFLVIILLVIFQKNVKIWGEYGYGNDVWSKFPIIQPLVGMELPRIPTFIGILEQPWRLFAPGPFEDMGCFLLVGTTGDNSYTELISNKPLTFERNPQTQEPEFNNPPYNHFSKTDFVFAFYARRYYTVLPQSVFIKWAEHEIEKWKAENLDKSLSESVLFYYSNLTTIENGEIQRKKELLKLCEIN